MINQEHNDLVLSCGFFQKFLGRFVHVWFNQPQSNRHALRFQNVEASLLAKSIG